MTFKDFLISKNIKFVEMDDEDVLVDEYTLIPFTEEIKSFILRYRERIDNCYYLSTSKLCIDVGD